MCDNMIDLVAIIRIVIWGVLCDISIKKLKLDVLYEVYLIVISYIIIFQTMIYNHITW